MKINLKAIMTRAWGIFRKPKHYHADTFAEALHRAWEEYKKSDEVAEIIANAIAESGITEVLRTWYGHKENGREVDHGEEHVLRVVVPYPAWGDGRTKILDFFTESQTHEITDTAM